MKMSKTIEFIRFMLITSWRPLVITFIISFGLRVLVGIAIYYELWFYTNDMIVWDTASLRNTMWGWLLLQIVYWKFIELKDNE